MRRLLTFTLLAAIGSASVSAAQPSSAGDDADTARLGTTAAEFSAGYTAFYDDGLLNHAGVGGALRVHLTPRLSVGPELSYHAGPGSDRDLILFGLVTFDLRTPRAGRAGRVEPYLLAGAGLLRHTASYGGESYSVSGRMVTWGGGTRVWLSRRVYAGADVRLGWEPHLRVLAVVGVAANRQGPLTPGYARGAGAGAR